MKWSAEPKVRKRPGRKPVKHDPAVAKALYWARRRVRLTQAQLGALVGVKWRAVSRWEISKATPTKAKMGKLVAGLERYDAATARTLAQALGVEVALAPPPPAPVSEALRAAVLRLADDLDVSPGRARKAVAALLERTRAAHFTVEGAAADLAAWIASEAAARAS